MANAQTERKDTPTDYVFRINLDSSRKNISLVNYYNVQGEIPATSANGWYSDGTVNPVKRSDIVDVMIFKDQKQSRE